MIGNILESTQIDPQLLQSQSQLVDSSRSQFEDLMRMSTDRIDLGGKTQQEQIAQLTNQFVSVAFIQPMMAQLRDSPFKTEMFSGGSAGDMFQQQVDTILSDRISQRANFPIARVMYERITGDVRPATPTNDAAMVDEKTSKPLQGIDQDG